MSEIDCESILDKISGKLDNIAGKIASLKTDVALNNLSHKNLNGELQEHKRDEKFRTNRNIAITAIMFTALGCWVGLKGLDTAKHLEPTAIVKEISVNDNPIKHK
jgi:hypothetical protein